MSSSDGGGRDDREGQRSRDGDAGEIQRLVWGRNEEEYDKILEYDERLKSTPPRSHVLSRKYGSKKANARKKR